MLKVASFIYLLFSALTHLISCTSKKDHLPNIDLQGAWVLYVMNINKGDSTTFKSYFPERAYIDFLSMDLIPILKDTIHDNNIILSYSCWENKTMIPVNLLTYHSVEFDSGKVKAVYKDGNIKINFTDQTFLNDSLLLRIIGDGKVMLSNILVKSSNFNLKSQN